MLSVLWSQWDLSIWKIILLNYSENRIMLVSPEAMSELLDMEMSSFNVYKRLNLTLNSLIVGKKKNKKV